MKRNIKANTVSWVALAALMGALTGCASHNYDEGTATGESLQAAATKIAVGQTNIDATMASLNDLVNNPQADLRPQFQKYSDSVDALDASAKDIDATVKTMRERGKKFMEQWEKQSAEIQNEDIRNLSAQRKQEVTQKLTAVKTSYASAQVAFTPLMSHLRDIQKYLNTDLTSAGVTAIKGTAVKCTEDAEKLKAPLADLSAQFKDLGASMSAVKSAAPQPQPQPQ